MIVAETDRLILRHLRPDDVEDLFRIYSDSETMWFMGSGSTTLEIERGNVANHITTYYEARGFGLWGTVLRSNGKLIGRCGILQQDIDGRKDAELAYLIDPGQWGNGYATEAARAIVSLAADRFRFERMIAVIHPENAASIKVAEKCGFQFQTVIDSYKDFGSVRLYSRDL